MTADVHAATFFHAYSRPGAHDRRALAFFAIVLAAAMLMLGCTGRPAIAPSTSLDIQGVVARFNAETRRGCYNCLRRVLDQYAALPESTKHTDRLISAISRTAVLLLLRQKELGIPVDDTWRIAESVATEAASRSAQYMIYLNIVDAMHWNTLGVDRDFVAAYQNEHTLSTAEQRAKWLLALTTTWRSDELGAYLYVTLNCEFPSNDPRMPATAPPQFDSSPLIKYRLATCPEAPISALRLLIATYPQFSEAQYFLANREVSARQLNQAEHDYSEAWKAIPTFTAAALEAADLDLTMEDFDKSITLADAILAIAPRHRQAMLCKITALSFLGTYRDARNTARTLLELGRYDLGDAYYWLSWNQYHLGDISAALTSVQQAELYAATADIYTLAGLIRMGRQEWSLAREQLLQAIERDDGRCDARFYLGRVDGELQDWQNAADQFTRSIECFQDTLNGLRRAIDQIEKKRSSDNTGAPKLQRRKQQADDTEARIASASYNAAVSFMTAGATEKAILFAERARTFKAYTERADLLLRTLKKHEPQ